MNPLQEPPAIVLVVDDAPTNVLLLKETLKRHYTVISAYSGAQALQLVRQQNMPDVILLDIMMPDMDGYEVLQQLKADPATAHIPVMFLTAMNEDDDELRGFDLGAADYISKPFSPAIVKARVRTQLELKRAKQKLAQQNQLLLEEQALVEHIVTHMRTSKEFDARHLQYLISPVCRSNGDILLAAQTPDGRQWVLLGDFTGHGLPAAVATPLVSHVFYSHVRQNQNITQTMMDLNAVLYAQLPADIFMAWSMVEIAANRQCFEIWSGGMPHALLLQGAEPVPFKPAMLPMGIVQQLELPERTPVSVQTGDRLYIYSDGISEVANPAGDLFSTARLAHYLLHKDNTTPLDSLLTLLADFHQDSQFADDISMVEVTM